VAATLSRAGSRRAAAERSSYRLPDPQRGDHGLPAAIHETGMSAPWLLRLPHLPPSPLFFSPPRKGFESQIGSNHFGHFYLTTLLLDKIMQDAQSNPNRIVVLSSKAHEFGTINVDDLHFKNGRQ
jgi:NAD(P)-dependent dehydrogenase (short-subunit alcohol dehydrogenase family)